MSICWSLVFWPPWYNDMILVCYHQQTHSPGFFWRNKFPWFFTDLMSCFQDQKNFKSKIIFHLRPLNFPMASPLHPFYWWDSWIISFPDRVPNLSLTIYYILRLYFPKMEFPDFLLILIEKKNQISPTFFLILSNFDNMPRGFKFPVHFIQLNLASLSFESISYS